ncbi:MAG: hypothetical protein N2V74_04415 [Candidatus Methanospirare jalkutatii]|nr:MAG: hypothetical protein N2V74_04415 [Candidatus Methanospirare jalkutatii]
MSKPSVSISKICGEKYKLFGAKEEKDEKIGGRRGKYVGFERRDSGVIEGFKGERREGCGGIKEIKENKEEIK